jgi:hypothetical protein
MTIVRDLAKLLSVGADHDLQSKLNEIEKPRGNGKNTVKSGNQTNTKKTLKHDIEFLNSHLSLVSASCQAS